MYSECTLTVFCEVEHPSEGGRHIEHPSGGGRHTRLTVTDAHLQQKKYEVTIPKISSTEMWLASNLDSGTRTEATAWFLRILWVLVYAGMRSADQQYIYRMC